MERTYFVSDCHLSEDRPQIIDLFIRFLDEHASSSDTLYILGDLFDYWIGDDMSLGKLGVVVNSLHELAQRIPVYFIHGNRDFLIGRRFAQSSGCQLLNETSIAYLQEERTLLLHGDLLCTDDISYQRYRKVIHNRFLRNAFTHLPLSVRLSIARRLRNASRHAIKSKKPMTMDVNSATVADYADRFEVGQIIHGHTHRQAIHMEGTNRRNWRRIVLGDWYESGNYLVMKNGIPELKAME